MSRRAPRRPIPTVFPPPRSRPVIPHGRPPPATLPRRTHLRPRPTASADFRNTKTRTITAKIASFRRYFAFSAGPGADLLLFPSTCRPTFALFAFEIALSYPHRPTHLPAH